MKAAANGWTASSTCCARSSATTRSGWRENSSALPPAPTYPQVWIRDTATLMAYARFFYPARRPAGDHRPLPCRAKSRRARSRTGSTPSGAATRTRSRATRRARWSWPPGSWPCAILPGSRRGGRHLPPAPAGHGPGMAVAEPARRQARAHLERLHRRLGRRRAVLSRPAGHQALRPVAADLFHLRPGPLHPGGAEAGPHGRAPGRQGHGRQVAPAGEGGRRPSAAGSSTLPTRGISSSTASSGKDDVLRWERNILAVGGNAEAMRAGLMSKAEIARFLRVLEKRRERATACAPSPSPCCRPFRRTSSPTRRCASPGATRTAANGTGSAAGWSPPSTRPASARRPTSILRRSPQRTCPT